MHTLGRITVIIALVMIAGCGNARMDDEEATAVFVECLERNGVEARDVRVTLNDDGTVGTIEALIVSEADAKYQPAVQLACTQEVESR